MSPQIPFPLREQPKAQGNQAFQPNLNVSLICPDCRVKPPHIVEEFASGDLVCGDCGLVLGDRIIDTRSEWRTFANDEGDVMKCLIVSDAYINFLELGSFSCRCSF